MIATKVINKLLLIIGALFLFFMMAIYVLWKIQFNHIHSLWQHETEKAKITLKNNLKLFSQDIEKITYDYTYWDDMVKFVSKPNKEWAFINLESTMPNFNVSNCWVFNSNLDPVYYYSTTKNNTKDFPLDKDILKAVFFESKYPHFFIKIENHYHEIFGAPIQYSNDLERIGKPSGYLFFSRIWNEDYVQEIGKHNNSILTLYQTEKEADLAIPQNNENFPENISIKIAIPGYDKNVAFYIVSRFKEKAIEEIKIAYQNQLPMWLLACFVFTLVVSASIILGIVKPLNILSKGVKHADILKLEKLSANQSEFGTIARLLIDFFNQKQVLENEIETRKRAEVDLLVKSGAIEQSPISIIITDRNGNVEYVNQRYIELSGYLREETISRNTIDILSISNMLEPYKIAWQKVIKTGEGWSGEVINRKKSGEYYWENVVIFPIINTKEKTFHFITLKEDITEKKRMFDELISAKEKAEESNKVKSVFFTNMSHELRTPLMGILGFAEIMIEENKDPDTVGKATVIHKSGKRLLDTLNKILNLSKAESIQKEVILTKVNVTEILEECFTLFEESAKQKNLNYKLVKDGVEYISELNEEMLHDIFNNLINNAIKFTNEGEITVSISGYLNDVVVSVKDTGIGMRQEALGFIFEEFRQVSEGVGRSFDGTGLGLTLTKKYIELLNGNIIVESALEKGSEFRVSFPTTKAETTQDDEFVLENMSLVHSNGERKKLLVVEDDQTTREAIKLFLNDIYDVNFATNEDSAFNLLENLKYDLILMDVNLGRGASGLDITKRIKNDSLNKYTPIIAATAFAMAGDKEEFLAAGCDYYISKPFTKKELITFLESVKVN